MQLSRDEKDKLDSWITQIQTMGSGLSAWEEGFVNDMEQQLKTKGWVSAKQAEILERILTEKS